MRRKPRTVTLLDVTVRSDTVTPKTLKGGEIYMAGKRKKLSAKGSQRLFTKTADYTHPKNAPAMVMRGGIRM